MSTCINNQYGYIFFHQPKTAGTSLSFVFGGESFHGNKHYTPKDCLNEKGRDYYNSFYKIVFVRNPYKILISNYYYMIKQKSFHHLMPPIPLEFQDDKGRPKFDYFIDWICDHVDHNNLMTIEEEIKIHSEGKPTEQYYTQYQWCSEKGSIDSPISIDFIGKVENIGNDVAKLRRMFFGQSYNDDVPFDNKSNHDKTIEDMYNKDMMKKVTDTFSVDFETFGYEKLC